MISCKFCNLYTASCTVLMNKMVVTKNNIFTWPFVNFATFTLPSAPFWRIKWCLKNWHFHMTFCQFCNLFMTFATFLANKRVVAKLIFQMTFCKFCNLYMAFCSILATPRVVAKFIFLLILKGTFPLLVRNWP